jgi:hypothetical protein
MTFCMATVVVTRYRNPRGEKEINRIMATKEVKAVERGEARGGMRIAKPQLAALIMAAAGVAIVFSISTFAAVARPLFLVAAHLGRVRQDAQRPPRTQGSTEWRSPGRSISRSAGP